MSETVRQMVVRLTMDAGGFKKAKSDIAGQIRNLDRELRGLGSASDTVGGRTALLTEKLDLQRKAVDNLKSAVAQAKTNLDNAKGSVDKLAKAKQLSALETDLANAESAAKKTADEIGRLQKRAEAVKFTQAGKSLDELGSKIKKTGKNISMYIGAPLAALGIGAFNTFKNYEAAIAMFRTKFEGTPEEFDGLTDAALRMSEEVPVGFEEIIGIMTGLAAAGVASKDIEKMTLTLAQMSAVTGMSTDQLSTQMVMFMNSLGMPMDNIDQLASALVELADKSVATENDIFSMATRMAATSNLAGMSAVDVFSLAAAFSSMGVQAEAGGSAASKLMKLMAVAAETGEGAEKFATTMGMSVEEFSASWKNAPADTMLKFFQGLANVDASGEDSVLAMLDAMKLTEIRMSNLIALGASNPEMFSDLMGVGAEGFAKNIALLEKSNIIMGTTASQMEILQNKMQNTSADAGENVADLAMPIIKVISDLVGEFGKLDEATQTRWVQLGGVLVLLGPVLTTIGAGVGGVGKLLTWIGKIKAGDVTMVSGLSKAFSAMGASGIFSVVAAGAGIYLLADFMSTFPTEGRGILESLANIKIDVDKESKDLTLAAIREVRAEAESLSGEREIELQGAAAAVEAGYGTQAMFGEAMEYARILTERDIKQASASYRSELNELNAAFKAAKDAGDEQLAATIGEKITTLSVEHEAYVVAAKQAYTEKVSGYVDGMMLAQPEARAAMEDAAKKYDLYALLQYMTGMSQKEREAMPQAEWDAMADMLYQGALDLGFQPSYLGKAVENFKNKVIFDFESMSLRDMLMASLTESIRYTNEGGLGYTLLSSIFSDPANLEMLDITAVQGSLDGLIESMDFKSAADKANGNVFKVGEHMVYGLADGVTANMSAVSSVPEKIKDDFVTKLRESFGIRSPSTVMAAEGPHIVQGLADGISASAYLVMGAIDGMSAQAVARAAAMGRAMSDAFNSNINFQVPAPGLMGGASINIKNGPGATDLYRLRQALNTSAKRDARGYGK